MTIIYQDDIGYIAAHPDQDITFYNGIALFDVNDVEYKISIQNIHLITKE